MNKKGQGSLEYLLIIGGAILVAAVVLAIITGLTASGDTTVQLRQLDGICSSIPQNQCSTGVTGFVGMDPDGAGARTPQHCRWSTTLSACKGCLNGPALAAAAAACVPAIPA